MVQPLWKTVWRFLKKLKIELLYDPAIPLLGIHQKETKALTQKDICTPVFITTLFIIANTWNQPKCPSVGEWIRKMCVCVYYSEIKRRKSCHNTKLIDTEDRLVVARGGGWCVQNWWWSKGTDFQL